MSQQVLQIYEQVDALTRHLQEITGMRCPPGCCTCCGSTEVEASPVELLPAAVSLQQRGELDLWLDRLEGRDDRTPCVFLDPRAIPGARGPCQIYPLRPLVCRLFGFAAVRARGGALELAACRVLRERAGPAISAAKALVHSGCDVPCYPDWSIRISSLAPGMLSRLSGINRACRCALERVGLEQRLAAWPPGSPDS